MKKLIYLSMLCFSSLLFGQISKELAKIVPAAPSVDGFMKHINFPVDKHTGLPSASYPIYSTIIDGIPLNISLNYHAGGIRVEERASAVGLGWNLSTGGMITRTVRGYPDDIDIGYIADGGTYNQVNRFFGLIAQYGKDYLNIPSSERTFFVDYNKRALNGEIDTEPDIFTFNVFGLSGKFVFTPQGEITLLNKQDIKLEKTLNNSGEIQNFTLTDGQGNTYYFNFSDSSETEVFPKTWSSGETSLGEDYTYTSSWRLSKIKTYLGKEINFSYISHGTTSKSLVESVSFKYNCTANGGAPPQDCNTFTKTLSGSINTAGEKLITKITFDGGSVHFNYSTYPAGNYVNDKKLNSIVVKDPHLKIIKEEKLTFSTLNNESGTRRLILANIQQFKGQKHLPKTSFEYYDATVFPSYDSKAVDLWGFYNSHSANTSLIHKTDIPQEILSIGGGAVQNTFANRNPDFAATRKGVLKSVTYPTGGTTEYTYELNDYGYDKNKALASSTNSSDGFRFNSPKVTSVVSCGEIYQDQLCGTSPNPISPCTNASFSADVSTAYGQSESSKVFTAPQSYQGLFLIYTATDGSTPTDAQGVSVVLQDMNGNQLYSYRNYFGTSYPTKTSPILDWQHDPNIVKLTAGTQYRIIASSEDECNAAYIAIHKVELVNNNQGNTFVNHKAGGLRIKEIRKYNATHLLQLKRSYTYKIAKDSARSSGVVKAVHRSKTDSKSYSRRKPVQTPLGCTSYIINYDNWTISSTPEVNFGNSKGSHITYRRVTEILEDFEQHRKQRMIYHYTSPYEFYGDDKVFQHTSRIDNDFRMGLEQKVELENENRNKVKETKRDFTYHTPSTNTIIGFSFFCNRYSNFNNFMGCTEGAMTPVPEAYNHEVYFYNKNTVALVQKDVENLVVENFTSETSYTYESIHSSLPTTTKTINSNNENLETKIYYPTDKSQLQNLSAESSQSLDALVAAHRIAEPIQVVSTKNGVKLATTRANFKDWGNLVLPDTVQIAKGLKKFKDKISYLTYDNKGNPLEVSKVDGTHIVYIWGYQQQHPIAKIENATYSQVAARVADLQNKSNADNDRTYGASGKEGILRTSLASLRNSLPKAMVTTFTYDPLIGVTSITDPSGDTSYYIYDAFNRLQYIKDTKGQVLKEYRYHYKEPELLATTTSSLQAATSGQQVQFTTIATGASGSLSYKWTVSNTHLNRVFTTSTGSLTINTTNNYAPNFTVSCQVTDAQSNQVVTTHTQVNVTVNAAPLQVSPINYNASNYRVGTMVNYSINVSGGSGNYKYSWSKTNSQRSYTYTNNTRTLSNRILSTDCTTFIVKCTVKDLGTGAIVTKSVKVYPTGCLQGPRGGNQR